MNDHELTMAQVQETGQTARCEPPVDRDLPGRQEFLFEDGHVWVLQYSGARVHSMRLAMYYEVPVSGWRHEAGCRCRWCAGSTCVGEA